MLVVVIRVMNDVVIDIENTVWDTVVGLVVNSVIVLAYLAIVAYKEKELTKGIVGFVKNRLGKKKK